MESFQLPSEFANYGPPIEERLNEPDAAAEQLELFDIRYPTNFIWKSPLERQAPIPRPLSIGSAEEDRKRFQDLRTQADRRFYLFQIYDEVGKMRALRDTRLIYDIDLPVMAKLVGIEEEVLERWEEPDMCQDPNSITDESGYIFDVVRLFVILDELDYSLNDVKEIVTRDIDDISKMMQRGGYYRFIDSVHEFLQNMIELRKLQRR